MIKNRIFKICLILVLLLAAMFLFYKLNLGKKVENKANVEKNVKKEEPKIISCTRTTRLENKPVYDRALSFIGEKYSLWDKEYLNGEESYSYFPSQLVNCIKINEGNLRNTTGGEGYFIFNGDEIKENYFPITVDQDYSYNDEAVNALLLIHEITHVQQYIDSFNKGIKLSCLDMEVDAFYTQLRFYSFQFPETRKSMDLRIQNDKDLNPQLQIIKNIQDQMWLNFDERTNGFFNSSGKSDHEKYLENFDKNIIKKLLLKNDSYKEECNL